MPRLVVAEPGLASGPTSLVDREFIIKKYELYHLGSLIQTLLLDGVFDQRLPAEKLSSTRGYSMAVSMFQLKEKLTKP